MSGNWTACKGPRRLADRAACNPVVRRFRAWTAVAVIAAVLPSCAARAGDTVTLSVANETREPLRCTVLFAHFVSQDLGTIAPRAEVSLSMFRQGNDGALWIPRADGRRMMIETIDCGVAAAETRGQVPLLSVRGSRHLRYHSACRRSGAVVCTDPVPVQ
jgi:hypothetical protein